MQVSPRKKNESGLFREVWKEFNKLVDYTRSISVMPSGNRGVQVQRTMNGTLLHVAPKEKPIVAGEVVRAKILASGMDEWTCQLDNGEYVEVAKPWTLRRTPYHGKTLTFLDEEGESYTVLFTYSETSNRKRVVSINGGEITETQVIIPRLLFGPDGDEYIFIAACEETGLRGVHYVDINADGRAWAKAD